MVHETGGQFAGDAHRKTSYLLKRLSKRREGGKEGGVRETEQRKRLSFLPLHDGAQECDRSL